MRRPWPRACFWLVIVIASGAVPALADDARRTTGVSLDPSFANPRRVAVEGLPPGSGGSPISVEEPFISRDGRFLFFNTAQHEGNKDLHYAEKAAGAWVYGGELGPGVNEPDSVQGNPTMDAAGHFYFVDASVEVMLQTGAFDAETGTLSQVRPLEGIPPRDVHLLAQRVHGNMGVEVSADGRLAFFSRATFALRLIFPAGIVTSDLGFAHRETETHRFVHDPAEVARVLQQINTEDLEYAASISADELELFFTRMQAEELESRHDGVKSSIWVARRSDPGAPFEAPRMIAAIGDDAFVEGPAIAPDGRTLYYHKREGNKFALWQVSRSERPAPR